jgi:hypothetical protein
VQHGVALAERAAFRNLAGEAHRMTFDGQRCKRGVGGGPISSSSPLAIFWRLNCFAAFVEMKPSGCARAFREAFAVRQERARLGAIIRFTTTEIGLPETGGRVCSAGGEVSSLNCFRDRRVRSRRFA